MSDTPRTDAFIELLEIEKLTVFDAIPRLQSWARGLEKENAILKGRSTYVPQLSAKDAGALMYIIQHGPNGVTRDLWMKLEALAKNPSASRDIIIEE